MRVVLQRVARASVRVGDEQVGAIGPGLLLLVGLCASDTDADVAYCVGRCLALRLWEVGGKQWTGSALSLGLPVLAVSQFTLYAGTRKAKPNFHRAMKPDGDAGAMGARELWERFVAALRAAHAAGDVQTGVFQAMMQVDSVNDGPVTVIVDSKNKDDLTPEPTSAPCDERAAAAGALSV